MELKYKNRYRIPSARLQTWDYSSNGAYFITICTKNRHHFFGEIPDKTIILNDIGQLAYDFWIEIPEHFSFVELGNFVIMPNHVHGVLIIDKNDMADSIESTVGTRQCLVSTPDTPNPETEKTSNTKLTPGQKRFQNQGKNTISSIVGSFKSVVTRNARKICPEFAWQPRFHDHIIRDSGSFDRIQNYIANNPRNWNRDKFYGKP